jgi:hypothetical protein
MSFAPYEAAFLAVTGLLLLADGRFVGVVPTDRALNRASARALTTQV